MRLVFRAFLSVVAMASIAACSGGGGAPPTSEQSAGQSSRPLQNAASVNAPFNYSVHPKLQRITDLLLHNCPNGTTGCALTPALVKNAYGFNLLKGAPDGTGQTIVIVVAFGSPTIQSDLATFSGQFSLPYVSPNNPNNPNPTLKIVTPGGSPTVNLSNAVQLGWAEETSLDVEWAHAAAPGANIVLVVGNNDQGQTIQSTLMYAASNYRGSAMSLSFGTPEAQINGGANNTQFTQAQAIYTTARSNNITVIASAGDLGATNGFPFANPQYPASDPNVLSVGGTNLTLANPQGKYGSETLWNDAPCAAPCGATGGAASIIFTAANKFTPSNCVSNVTLDKTERVVSDVAFDAADAAVDVFVGFNSPLGVSRGWYEMGGTSVGPPVYAGIVAVANQMRGRPVGYVNDWLYSQYKSGQATKSPPFNDVTGLSTFTNAFPSGPIGSPAKAGYDMPTGLGTPNTNNLLNVLVNKQDSVTCPPAL